GAQHSGTRAPADMIAQLEIAGVEIGLRADPDLVANLAMAIKAPLDIGAGADEDIGADVEGFEMLEADLAADLQTRTAGTGAGLEDQFAHQRIELAVAGGKAGIGVEEMAVVVFGQPFGEAGLEGGIAGSTVAAVDGLDRAGDGGFVKQRRHLVSPHRRYRRHRARTVPDKGVGRA